MEFIIVAIITIVVLAIRGHLNKRKRAKQERVWEVVELAEKSQSAFERINSVKGIAAKVNNCKKALGYLYAAAKYDECQETIKNYNSLVTQLSAMELVFPFFGYLEKAAKFRFKENEKSEKNALLDALYEVEQNNISDADISDSELIPDGYNHVPTIQDIRDRLAELGWEDQKSIEAVEA